ncbi:MAG TPA: hypothetical protein VMV18_05910, partial [bacterium]|nr:hypothetical protein [bacterium]
MRTLIRTLLPLLLLSGAPALAVEEATPAASPAVTTAATPTDGEPAAAKDAAAAAKDSAREAREKAKRAQRMAETVPPAPPAAPAAPAAPPPPPVGGIDVTREEKNVTDALREEITYRMGRAHRRFERGPVADAQKPEIQAALDRAQSQIDAQLARVEKAQGGKEPAEAQLALFRAEVSALGGIAHSAAGQIEAVRT